MTRWLELLGAPAFDDFDLNRRASILHRSIVAVMLALAGLAVISVVQPGADPRFVALIYLPMLAWHAACLGLIRSGRVHSAAALYTGMLFATVSGVVTLCGGMSGQNASAYIVVVVLAAFTQSGRWAIAYAVLATASALALLALEMQGWLPEPLIEQGPVDNSLSIIATALVSALVAYLALGQLESALASARGQLANNRRILKDLETSHASLSHQAHASEALAALGQDLVATRGHDALTELTARTIAEILGADADLRPFDRSVPEGALVLPVPRRGVQPAQLVLHRDEPFGPDDTRFAATVVQMLATALEREDLDAQVTKAQRMQALGQLAGGIAHDFNNLLVVISGNAELLQDALDTSHPESEALVADTLAASRRASDLTRKLLSFARPLPEEASTSQMEPLLHEVAGLLRRALGHAIEVQVEVMPDLPAVSVSEGDLHQILVNLGVNAGDAMPAGGMLTLTAWAERGEDGQDGVTLEVRDTGHGMPSHVAAHAFEPFFTTKPEGRGTGLGLATVWGLVQSRGGTITLQSAPDEGTRFLIWLPAADPLPRKVQTSPGALPPGLHVLVVDDDPAVRRTVARMLQRLGFRVGIAASGLEALAPLIEDPPDVLLTDVRMPGLDGPELVSRAREKGFAGNVIYMSGFVDNGSDLGQGVLAKPFTGETLIAHLEALAPLRR